MSDIRLSKSAIDKFVRCPRCFYLQYKHKLGQPDLISSKVWKGIERITQAHYERYRVARETPPNLLGMVPADAIPYQGGERKISLKDLRYWGHGLAFKVDGVLVTTALDDMLQWLCDEHAGSTRYNIIDYKSKSKATDEESTGELYANQADIFDLAANVNGYETDGRVFFDYWYPIAAGDSEPLNPALNGDHGKTHQLWGSQVIVLKADHERAKRLVLAAAACLERALPPPTITKSTVTRGQNKGQEKVDGCPVCVYVYEREALLGKVA